jgi:hypothetical protein
VEIAVTATPENVGFSTRRLERVSEWTQRQLDSGRTGGQAIID